MTFGSQMDYAVDIVASDKIHHGVEITDVLALEHIVGSILDVAEIGEIAGVCEFVDIDDSIFRIFVDKKTDNVGADKSGASGDYDVAFKICHVIKIV